MNQQLVPFDFEGRPVRVVTDSQGEPWFVAADVLATIGLDRKALERLDDDEKGVSSIHTPGGGQEMTTVNEPGLYTLVLGSRKAEAKRFKRWVTHEVLPSIRKNGSYAVPSAIASLPAPTQDRVTALLLIGEAVAKVPGVKAGIAMAATLTCIQENTGLAVETLRRDAAGRQRAHLRAQRHPARKTRWAIGKDHQPASGGPRAAVPQRSRRMGTDRSRGSLGRGHAVFPQRPQRLPDSLESDGG
jgi:prophage antirepressor-like protein